MMTTDMLLVFGLLAATIILFVSDRLRLDLVAMLALLALLLLGLLTPAEALAGFADPIVLIIAGLFVVGGGLFHSGVADAAGPGLADDYRRVVEFNPGHRRVWLHYHCGRKYPPLFANHRHLYFWTG